MGKAAVNKAAEVKLKTVMKILEELLATVEEKPTPKKNGKRKARGK